MFCARHFASFFQYFLLEKYLGTEIYKAIYLIRLFFIKSLRLLYSKKCSNHEDYLTSEVPWKF